MPKVCCKLQDVANMFSSEKDTTAADLVEAYCCHSLNTSLQVTGLSLLQLNNLVEENLHPSLTSHYLSLNISLPLHFKTYVLCSHKELSIDILYDHI